MDACLANRCSDCARDEGGPLFVETEFRGKSKARTTLSRAIHVITWTCLLAIHWLLRASALQPTIQPRHSWSTTTIGTSSPLGRRVPILRATEEEKRASHENNTDSDNSILDLLTPDAKCDTTRMSGTDLAYIGDVVFELYARSRYVWPPKRTSELQTTVVECVRAESQSKLLASLKAEFPLSEKEQQILSRGRNAVTRSRNNRRDPATYQDSTAVEALVGYLYIDDKQRCEEFLRWTSTQLK